MCRKLPVRFFTLTDVERDLSRFETFFLIFPRFYVFDVFKELFSPTLYTYD